MSIVVVGSVAFDNVASPSGKAENLLGGAATFFALAASYFTQVRVVGVVGDDFTAQHFEAFKKRDIDTRGIERVQGKTFRWGGHYTDNLNEAKTDFTELNVFEKFEPHIPAEYRDSQFLFLANIHPDLQALVRREMNGVRLTGGDTMNYWIQRTRAELERTLKVVDVLLINDTEVKMLAHNEPNLLRAARKAELNREVLKRALFYGSVMGSFAVEEFGTTRLQNLTREQIDARFQLFRELTHLD
ncbi:MAG: sugar kinase [Acidobacteria bacterium]|nr:MAG: sugar kinase [Acidobacteriota bacterium]